VVPQLTSGRNAPTSSGQFFDQADVDKLAGFALQHHLARANECAVLPGQADRLSRLIDDMLLVSRVEAGQMLRRRDRVTLDWVLDQVLSVGRSIAFPSSNLIVLAGVDYGG